MALFDKGSSLYIPYSSLSFDRTSLKRLHISQSDFKANSIEYQKPKLYTGNSIKKWSSFFSERESGLVKKLLYCPLTLNDEIRGFFILVDDRTVSSESYRENLLLYIKKLTPLFFQAREKRFSRMTTDWYVLISDYQKKIIEFCSKIKEPIQFILLDYTFLIERLEEIYFCYSHSVKMDCLKLTTSLFSDKANLFDLPGNKSLLVSPVSRFHDYQIMLEQMRYAFKELFTGVDELPDFQTVIQVMDGESPEDIKEFIELNTYE